MTAQLNCRHLKKSYNGKVIFQGISCTCSAGEPFVVTGPNGAGKSTLLKVICGLLRPTAGSIELEIDGNTIERDQLYGHVGYVSPDMNMYDNLTAYENLDFFAAVRGNPMEKAQIMDILELTQLKEASHKFVGHYSSGMKQRLKLAGALLNNPRVLILDEPSTNLDTKGKNLLKEIVADRKKKSIIIIATNETEEVALFGQSLLQLGNTPGRAS